MIFFFSKTTAELGATVAIKATAASGGYENTARLTRVKTLDGSSVFTHSGVTDTDRDVPIEARLTRAEADKILSLFKSPAPVRIGWVEGSFKGYIYNLTIGPDLRMTGVVYLESQLNL